MLPELQEKLTRLIQETINKIVPDNQAQIKLERPKQASHGDIATNIAMQLAKPAKRNPRELAQEICDALIDNPEAQNILATAEIAGPGFINFRLKPETLWAVIEKIAAEKEQYGHSKGQADQKVMVEFVSANPTGPLHVGHARQAALGDCICRLFAANGAEVHREFYYNDAGNQINALALSVQARAQGIDPDDANYPEDGYRGDYILDIANDFMAQKTILADGQEITASGDSDNLSDIRRFAVAYLRREQDLDLQAFNLIFDEYYLESSLYTDGKVEETVQTLTDNGHVYEKDGALWLKTTELNTGDDKDRVMRKSDGSYTYFLPDVAYHRSKWERGYKQAINIQGSDHHGTVARVRAGLQGLELGIPKDYPDYILHKMVRVMRDGEEVKISKRAGSYVTMRDLIDWVGQDAVRFFLIQRRADTEFTFDVDLALSKSEENPVFYVQYAHARICKLLMDSANLTARLHEANTSLLTAPSELTLLKRLSELPNLIEMAARELSPHHLVFWLIDCAADFHSWYNAERIMVDDEELKLARLSLANATRQVIANGLDLLGVSAPQRM
ncbi:Arginine--tRNA ligase [Oligella ureolytica]|uniref:Arginine--tRNA ligase n=1 Tax=Oligella ureolytica TaxID=90244 RepID=A0A378XFF9_9BURK|nr:arginine--tRNA ligase [Oligella ureolytica]QPT39065.1 arginine--tRNA ligase [Oligella ureolytica]SUA54685.1 Arginine--tRNA ligase [Oligella ureolytica]SUA55792.1 Arginine--tRNA ligase [Oligella ureolytica]